MPTPTGPTPLWRPGSIPDNWADVCGFLKPPGSHRFWKVHKHGAFSIPRKTLGPRPTDQSCHHEAWLHLDFVDWNNRWSKHDVSEQHISLKERPADYPYGTPKRRMSEVMSDHSLSSQTCDRSHVVLSRCHTATVRSLGATLSSSPSDPSEDDACLACPFPSVTCVLSVFFISHRTSRCTVRKCLMSKKKRCTGQGSCTKPNCNGRNSPLRASRR